MDAPQRATNLAARALSIYRQRKAAIYSDPVLRGEPKVAWDLIYECLADYECKTIDVHPGWLAAKMGKTDRSGVRALEALAERGYLQVIDRKGTWKVFLNDPLEVATARLGQMSDGQGVLFEAHDGEPEPTAADEPEIIPAHRWSPDATATSSLRPAVVRPQPPADVAQHPPNHARALTSETSEERNLSKTSDFGRLRDFQGATDRRSTPSMPGRGNGTTSADREQLPPAAASGSLGTFGDALLARLAGGGMSETERIRERERLVAHMLRSVRDDRLREAPCLKVADAILDGRYTERELYRVLAYVAKADRDGKCKNGRWAAFVGTVNRSMAEQDRRAR